MTASPSIDPDQFLHEHLARASPDLMWEMLATFAKTLLSAQADSVCGAEYGTRSRKAGQPAQRVPAPGHPGRYARCAIPKLSEGSFFPDWLPQRRHRAEATLTTVVATCYLLRVSTLRMDRLVQSLGITGLSKSQVSEMATDLDGQVNAFRTRPLDACPYTFLAADVLTMKVRKAGRVIKVAVIVATGVTADGSVRTSACKSQPEEVTNTAIITELTA